MNQRRCGLWYNSQIRMFKQKAWEIRKEVADLHSYRLAWKDCLLTIKKALRKTRIDHYTFSIEENQNNPRFLFSTIAKLNITSIFHPHVPSTVEDFKSFFTNKMTTFREKANQAKSCDMVCCIRSDISDQMYQISRV